MIFHVHHIKFTQKGRPLVHFCNTAINELNQLIKDLRIFKSPGPDEIGPKLVKSKRL
jgi:hypothetical protein